MIRCLYYYNDSQMNIVLNNEIAQVHDGMTIEQLLYKRNITSKYIAVEVNRKIVPKSDYKKYILFEGDKIEIITAIGGG